MDLIREKFKIYAIKNLRKGWLFKIRVKERCQDKVTEKVEFLIRNCTWNIMNIVDEEIRRVGLHRWRKKLTP